MSEISLADVCPPMSAFEVQRHMGEKPDHRAYAATKGTALAVKFQCLNCVVDYAKEQDVVRRSETDV